MDFQNDGNLVLKKVGGAVIWNAGTAGKVPGRVVMQGDGNLVMLEYGKALWHTHTYGNPGSKMSVFVNGDLVVTNKNNKVLWAVSWDNSAFKSVDTHKKHADTALHYSKHWNAKAHEHAGYALQCQTSACAYAHYNNAKQVTDGQSNTSYMSSLATSSTAKNAINKAQEQFARIRSFDLIGGAKPKVDEMVRAQAETIRLLNNAREQTQKALDKYTELQNKENEWAVVPTIPEGVIVDSGKMPDQLRFRWNVSTGNVSHYDVEWSEGPTSRIDRFHGLESGDKYGYFIVPNHRPNTTYSYRVKAVHPDFRSNGWSVKRGWTTPSINTDERPTISDEPGDRSLTQLVGECDLGNRNACSTLCSRGDDRYCNPQCTTAPIQVFDAPVAYTALRTNATEYYSPKLPFGSVCMDPTGFGTDITAGERIFIVASAGLYLAIGESPYQPGRHTWIWANDVFKEDGRRCPEYTRIPDMFIQTPLIYQNQKATFWPGGADVLNLNCQVVGHASEGEIVPVSDEMLPSGHIKYNKNGVNGFVHIDDMAFTKVPPPTNDSWGYCLSGGVSMIAGADGSACVWVNKYGEAALVPGGALSIGVQMGWAGSNLYAVANTADLSQLGGWSLGSLSWCMKVEASYIVGASAMLCKSDFGLGTRTIYVGPTSGASIEGAFAVSLSDVVYLSNQETDFALGEICDGNYNFPGNPPPFC